MTAQLSIPAALVPGSATPCPCAASAPRGSTEALPPGDARACGQPAAPAQAFPMSMGPCAACGGVGVRVHEGACRGTGSAGTRLIVGAWLRCARGHEWRREDARTGKPALRRVA